MTNNPTVNEPQDTAPSAPARRSSPLGARLAPGRSAVLGRGLDALLGNLGRDERRQHQAPPDPEATADDEDTQAKKYQTQARRALLSRLQTGAAAPALSTAASAAPSRTDLGRGFAQLMQAGQPAGAAGVYRTGPLPVAGGEYDENRVICVDVERLEPSPYHGSRGHDPAALRGLAQSVRELGVWQPLVVMPAVMPAPDGGPRYWIIAGEQRWLAARMVGLHEVPVLVRQVTPRAGLQLSLAQDAHPEPLSPLVRCLLYSVLTGDMGMSIEEIAVRVGVEPHEVLCGLAVLEADEFLQESFDRGEIGADCVVSLMQAPTVELRRELLRYAIRYRWDAARLEKALHARGIER